MALPRKAWHLHDQRFKRRPSCNSFWTMMRRNVPEVRGRTISPKCFQSFHNLKVCPARKVWRLDDRRPLKWALANTPTLGIDMFPLWGHKVRHDSTIFFVYLRMHRLACHSEPTSGSTTECKGETPLSSTCRKSPAAQGEPASPSLKRCSSRNHQIHFEPAGYSTWANAISSPCHGMQSVQAARCPHTIHLIPDRCSKAASGYQVVGDVYTVEKV